MKAWSGMGLNQDLASKSLLSKVKGKKQQLSKEIIPIKGFPNHVVLQTKGGKYYSWFA